MKTIYLKRIALRNFKGLESFAIDFTSNETNILGKNTAGKTTIFDAYNWLLFGKDSLDRTDFPIKTYDKDNNIIPKLEHEVSGIILSGSEEIELRRLYTEKWTRKRGNDIEELTGHETSFYINGVEKKKGEYEAFVKQLIDEQISKVITNPLYFMEKMKWNERREILSTMAGEISNEMVLEQFGNSEQLKQLLSAGKDLQEQKQVLRQKIKLLETQLSEIGTRLLEVNREGMFHTDFEAIENEIETKTQMIKALERSIVDIQEANSQEQKKVINAQNEKFKLNTKLNELQSELTLKNSTAKNEVLAKRMDIEREITHLKNQIENIQTQAQNIEQNIASIQAENDNLREQYKQTQTLEFQLNQNDVCCPTCKREFDNSTMKVEELKSSFNTNKNQRLTSINETGVLNNKRIEDLKLKLSQLNKSELESKLEAKQLELQNFNASIQSNKLVTTPEIEQIKKQIEAFVIPEIQTTDFSELLTNKNNIQEQLDELKAKLHAKDELKRKKERQTELTIEKQNVAQEIAHLQRIDADIDQFNKAKIEIVENRINGLFKLVSWKMFNVQVNGGLEPTCEAIVDGKPYAAMNKALQMNVGIDIVNALNLHYGILAPIFIDNRESITTLIASQSQIVNLIVDKDSDVLTVQNV
jgi:DNA repair exonuclease SbcCD ATPase subunit